jgi:RNA polymerase sigma-70 factor (family 1)
LIKFIPIGPNTENTDATLLSLWRNGDERAFEMIYSRHFIRLLNLAYKKTGHMEASQELVQDVFLSLHRQLPTLQEHTVLENYLFIATRNRIFNYHRQLLLQLKKEAMLRNQLPVESGDSQETLELKELETRLRAKIQELPQQCRTVFLLSRDEQLSNKEVAERLQISVNTVEQHMRKALRILRASFNDELSLMLLLLVLKHTAL